MSQTPTPPIEGYANYLAGMATVDGSELFSESPLPLQLLKSLDDLDEEEDEDEDDDDDVIEDLDEEEDEDDLEDDYDEDDDDDEDDEEEDDEEDGGVKPLKMA